MTRGCPTLFNTIFTNIYNTKFQLHRGMSLESPFALKHRINRPSNCGATLQRPRLSSKFSFKENRPEQDSRSEYPPIKQRQLSPLPLVRSISRSMSKSPARLTPTSKPLLTPSKCPSNVTFGYQQHTYNSKQSLQNTKQSTSKTLKPIKSRDNYPYPTSPSFSNIGSQKSASYSDAEYFKHLFSSKSLISPPQRNESQLFKNERERQRERQKEIVVGAVTMVKMGVAEADIKSQLEQIYNGKFKIMI